MSGRVLVNGRLISLAAAARRLRAHAPGKHSQKSHGGGGGSSDDEPEYTDADLERDEGKYGFGRDPNGVDYTEFDVDEETGEPKFSSEYRDKYGPLEFDTEVSERLALRVAGGERGGVHLADDSRGTMDRQVVQDFTPKQANDLGRGVYDVYSGTKASHSSAGVQVRPASDNPTRDGVNVTWANGRQDRFDGEAGADEAFELQQALDLS